MQAALGALQHAGEVKKIKGAVLIREEAVRAVVSTLNGMYCHSGEHDSRAPRHEQSTALHALALTENVVCPCLEAWTVIYDLMMSSPFR
jgi:hypothetical protein